MRRRDLWRKGSVRNGLIDGQSKNTGIESRDVDTLIAQLGGDKHRQELRRLLWSESNGGASRCAGSILRYYPVCVCVCCHMVLPPFYLNFKLRDKLISLAGKYLYICRFPLLILADGGLNNIVNQVQESRATIGIVGWEPFFKYVLLLVICTMHITNVCIHILQHL